MIPTVKEVKIIQRRIAALNKAHVIRLSFLPVPYRKLSELEKIPLRVHMAEIEALTDYMCGRDLDKELESCVENEYYCYAEGIKKVKEWVAKGKKNFP